MFLSEISFAHCANVSDQTLSLQPGINFISCPTKAETKGILLLTAIGLAELFPPYSVYLGIHQPFPKDAFLPTGEKPSLTLTLAGVFQEKDIFSYTLRAEENLQTVLYGEILFFQRFEQLLVYGQKNLPVFAFTSSEILIETEAKSKKIIDPVAYWDDLSGSRGYAQCLSQKGNLLPDFLSAVSRFFTRIQEIQEDYPRVYAFYHKLRVLLRYFLTTFWKYFASLQVRMTFSQGMARFFLRDPFRKTILPLATAPPDVQLIFVFVFHIAHRAALLNLSQASRRDIAKRKERLRQIPGIALFQGMSPGLTEKQKQKLASALQETFPSMQFLLAI